MAKRWLLFVATKTGIAGLLVAAGGNPAAGGLAVNTSFHLTARCFASTPKGMSIQGINNSWGHWVV